MNPEDKLGRDILNITPEERFGRKSRKTIPEDRLGWQNCLHIIKAYHISKADLHYKIIFNYITLQFVWFDKGSRFLKFCIRIIHANTVGNTVGNDYNKLSKI